MQYALPAVLTSLQEALEFHVQDWQMVLKDAVDQLDTARAAFRQAHLLARCVCPDQDLIWRCGVQIVIWFVHVPDAAMRLGTTQPVA